MYNRVISTYLWDSCTYNILQENLSRWNVTENRKPGKFAIISLNDTGFVSSSKPTFLHSEFVDWDLKWYGMKWNIVD